MICERRHPLYIKDFSMSSSIFKLSFDHKAKRRADKGRELRSFFGNIKTTQQEEVIIASSSSSIGPKHHLDSFGSRSAVKHQASLYVRRKIVVDENSFFPESKNQCIAFLLSFLLLQLHIIGWKIAGSSIDASKPPVIGGIGTTHHLNHFAFLE